MEDGILKRGAFDSLQEVEIPSLFPHTSDLDCLRFFLNIC